MISRSDWDCHLREPYLVLICGSRDWEDEDKIAEVLEDLYMHHPDLMIIEGECPGADQIARVEADMRGIPVVRVPAQWVYYGRSAGPRRNRWMLSLQPCRVLAFHDNIESSKGTADTLKAAEEAEIPTEVISHD